MFGQYQNIIIPAIGGLLLVLLAWNIILQVSISKLKKKQSALFAGKDGKSLEQIILGNNMKIQAIGKDIKDLYEITSKVHALAHSSIHRVSTVRFNPFRDLGGDQSFSVALLDGNNSGVVISSLYSRDGVRVYAKALKQGQSEKYPLTEEEKQAIETASIAKAQ